MKQPLSIERIKESNGQGVMEYIVMIGLIVSLTASCSASEEQEATVTATQAEETDANLSQSAYCDYWGDYAIIILENYEAQKTAGMDNPLDNVKRWMTYDNSEAGSPSRVYFDAVLMSLKSQQTPQMVREVGEKACAKFTEDQMDSANFYDAIE